MNPIRQGPLVLGTVQLGLDYGFANDRGLPSLTSAAELLRTASALGITHLDTARMDPGFVAELARRTVVGEYGRPRDLAAALLFLAAPSATFTTGSTVVVDGGWTVR